MSKPISSITSLPRSPEDDRHARMVKYSITMAIRFVCIAMCLIVQGWWLLVFAVGAVVLPYFAVIVANAVDARAASPERPDSTPRMISAGKGTATGSDDERPE